MKKETVKMNNYLKRLLTETSEQEQAQFLAESADIQAQADLLAVKREVSNLTQALNQARAKKGEEYSLTEVVQAKLNLADAKAFLAEMEKEYASDFSKD